MALKDPPRMMATRLEAAMLTATVLTEDLEELGSRTVKAKEYKLPTERV